MMDASSRQKWALAPGLAAENWPSDDVYDPQLLADGDRRNVEDRYRWRMEAIIADIAAHALPFEIAIEFRTRFQYPAQSFEARML